MNDLKKKITEDYWYKKLSGEMHEFTLPFLHSGVDTQKDTRSSLEFNMSRATLHNLKRMSKGSDIGLFILVLCGLYVVTKRYAAVEDIWIGTLTTHSDQKNDEIIFCNTRVGENALFKDLIEAVKRQVLESFNYHDYSFAEMYQRLQNEKKNEMIDLFNLAFLYDRIHNVEKNMDRFHVLFTLLTAGNQVKLRVDYRTENNASGVIENFCGNWLYVLDHFSDHLDKRIAQLDIIRAEEREKLSAFHHSGPDVAVEGNIVDLFGKNIKNYPDRIAVVEDDKHLTYHKLDQQADQIARYLHSVETRNHNLVGIMFYRSTDIILAILGVLKSGQAYLPIDPTFPENRILSILTDSRVSVILTEEKIIQEKNILPFLSRASDHDLRPTVTGERTTVQDMNTLPIPDRTLIDYKKYHAQIGNAPAKNTITIQGSRGCPFHCLFCHKIWNNQHLFRDAENIFEEILYSYEAGIRRFVFVDDIFNFNEKNGKALFQKIIRHHLDLQLFFPNGLRADILTKEYIDLLVEAGTVDFSVALESASPRIQKLIGKNLHLEKFAENVDYIIQKYPQVILEMEMMFGFPTESEEEALATYDFLNQLHWIHFPNLNILKIYPHSDISALAIQHGVSPQAIARSANLAFHEIPETLPFSKEFARAYQTRFMTDYFLAKERLLSVLPRQMKILTEEELIKKYDSYLPARITSMADILSAANILPAEFNPVYPPTKYESVPDYTEKISKYFPEHRPDQDAVRVLFLDLSQYFSADAENMLYDVVEAPLGLLYLTTFLNQKLGRQFHGKIAKARIDFDNFDELKELIARFNPDLIGIRTLSFYKNFFHKSIALIKLWFPDKPVIVGGPYATSDYASIVTDTNVDIAVIGEGELTLLELIKEFNKHDKKLPPRPILENIAGIAFLPEEYKKARPKILLWDQIQDEIKKHQATHLTKKNTGDQTAYVLYTSGSTGLPKGVMMGHQPLVNLVQWQIRQPVFRPALNTLQFAPLTFDVSFQELFSTWCSAGKLIVISDDLRKDIHALLLYIRQMKVERLFLPYVILNQLAEMADNHKIILEDLKEVITAGEALRITPAIAAFFKRLPSVTLANQYGPIETHVVTQYLLSAAVEDWPTWPPIGKPVQNCSCYVLNENLDEVPLGVSGELFIGNAPLAYGYLHRPDLTAERFLANPFGNEYDARLYKTGDRARYRTDGNLEFLGRMDHQVKIRGFRVEPGEIESLLREHLLVHEVVVLAYEDRPGDRRLFACLVPRYGQILAVSDLRNFLHEKLPDYMIPSTFLILKALPLLPNGKVDFRALLALKGVRSDIETTYAAPRNELERQIAAIWQEILDLERVGIYANFFELGGHSLVATKVISRLRQTFLIELPLRELLKAPTIAGLAGLIEQKLVEKVKRLSEEEIRQLV